MNTFNLIFSFPEIAILFAILFVNFLSGHKQRLSFVILMLLATAALAVMQMQGATQYYFMNMYQNDALANFLKMLITLSTALSLLYMFNYLKTRECISDELPVEFHMILLCSVLGQMVIVSAHNLLVVYLGIELMSLASYSLVALKRNDRKASEAAIKYFVLGALASGFLLYGFSMLYGATGSLNLADIAYKINAGQANQMILVFALVFIVAGLAFKLGVVPFHMWVPDVYQGAPTAITLLLTSTPKLAVFALFIRILAENLTVLAPHWQMMLWVLAFLSLVVGNLAALMQRNLKRLLAYSTIAQMGFMLLGLLSGVVNGNNYSAVSAYSASLFYVTSYLLTTIAAFGLILFLNHQHEVENIDDLRGIYQRSPWFALMMMLVMLSLAGIPPLLGFYAKLLVFQALLNANHFVLLIIAAVASLIGAFYYLRVIKAMYFDEVSPDTAAPVVGKATRAIFLVHGSSLLVLGILPGGLMNLCSAIMRKTLAM